MAKYAQTQIRHGFVNGAGEPEQLVIEEGDTVKVGGEVTKELVEQWEETGAVADHPPIYEPTGNITEIQERDQRIEELEAALAEARGEKPPDHPPKMPTSPTGT